MCKFPIFYVSLYLQCPIMCKFSIFLPFIPIMGKYPIVSHLSSLQFYIISSVSHYVQVLQSFTFHSIFSVPLCASSLTSYVSLYLQCPILGKYPIVLRFIISSVSHYVQVLQSFTFHSIFSILCKFPNFLCFVISYPIILCFIIYLVSHYVQVPCLFTFHYFLCAPLCASSPSFYIPLYLQCPILGKFPLYLHSIRSSVSHYVHVPYLFTFHYIFSFPLCASSLTSYVSLYLQCPILGKYPIVLHFILSSVSHYMQVLHIFTFHSIFSVPFCASSLTSYVSLYLQCPILGKYPIILCFIIYLVSHYVQVPYLFTFHQIFSVPLCASSPFFSISLYIQCPILGKFPIYLHFIRSSVSHYVQVLHFFPFHYIFSFPFLCASSLLLIRFIIFLVSHSGQVTYSSTFHYICSVPL